MRSSWDQDAWRTAREEVIRLNNVALDEFSHIADYIWKSPRLLESERQLETAKLDQYFPNQPALQAIRWRHEEMKLEQAFPFLIAQGNLFSVVSTFEIYLLLLAKALEPASRVPLSSVRGQGVSRCLEYLKQLGFDLGSLTNWEQLNAALTIRNLFVHASGSLKLSRDAAKIHDIVKAVRFLEPSLRDRRRQQNRPFDEVQIVAHPVLGERLQITNDYPHYLTAALRDCFLSLCDRVASENAG